MTSGEHAMNVFFGIDLPRIVCGDVTRRSMSKFVYRRAVSRKTASRRSVVFRSRRVVRRAGFLDVWSSDQTKVEV